MSPKCKKELGAWEFHVMIKAGCRNEIENNLRLSNINVVNSRFQQETLLATAIKCGFTDIVNMLLKHGADPNLRSFENGRNETPLLTATRLKHFKIVKLLVKHKADIKKTSFNGEDAICQAVIENAFEILEYFLENLEPTPSIHQHQHCPLLITLKYAEQFTGKRKCLFTLIRYRYQCGCFSEKCTSFNTTPSFFETIGNGYLYSRIMKCEQFHITIYLLEPLKLFNFARVSIRSTLLQTASNSNHNYSTLVNMLPLPPKLINFLQYKNNTNAALTKESEIVDNPDSLLSHRHYIIKLDQ